MPTAGIASSHCAVNLDGTLTHFIMIRRDREADFANNDVAI
jgi:hypothetical protein